MNRKLFLFLIGFMLVLSINAVSAGFWDYWTDYDRDTYKETSEYTKTTESSSSDYYTSTRTKHTISEKTEYYESTRTPRYRYHYYPRYSGYGYAPYSSWRYKEPYSYRKDVYGYYGDYYYQPRYDSNLGYYNWRY